MTIWLILVALTYLWIGYALGRHDRRTARRVVYEIGDDWAERRFIVANVETLDAAAKALPVRIGDRRAKKLPSFIADLIAVEPIGPHSFTARVTYRQIWQDN